MADNENNPVSAVIMVADPDESPVLVYAEEGGTLEWRSESPNYPEFEILFVGDSPAEANDKLFGTTKDPVVVHATKLGTYHYKIRHFKNDGSHRSTGTHSFSVSTCKNCKPGG